MREILAFVMILTLSGCATGMYAFGDSYHASCEGTMIYSGDTGSISCDGEWTEHAGGQLSRQAAGMITGIVAGIRNAALAAIGVQVPKDADPAYVVTPITE